MAGHFTGYMMQSGSITVLDGCGNDTGAEMQGGHIIVRGATGARVGGGMSDGLIVVHGDVGPDPRDSPTGSPEDGAGEDEEGLVGPGEVPGSTGNRRKRNRKSSDEIEDGKEPPD